MDKAIVVIDMPKSCYDCKLRTKVGAPKCLIADKFCTSENATFYFGKPQWCPLLKMPEKSYTGNSDYYQWGDYEDGWNDCINRILGGAVL